MRDYAPSLARGRGLEFLSTNRTGRAAARERTIKREPAGTRGMPRYKTDTAIPNEGRDGLPADSPPPCRPESPDKTHRRYGRVCSRGKDRQRKLERWSRRSLRQFPPAYGEPATPSTCA